MSFSAKKWKLTLQQLGRNPSTIFEHETQPAIINKLKPSTGRSSLSKRSTTSFLRLYAGASVNSTNDDTIEDVSTKEQMQLLSDLVMKGFQDINVTAESVELLKFPPPSPDRITRYRLAIDKKEDESEIDDDFSALEAWVMPKNGVLAKWPNVAMDSKQRQSWGPNVIFRRVNDASVGRTDASLNLLLRGEPTLWIGLPGIGKSMSTTVMLVKALQSMITRKTTKDQLVPNGFDEVVYRIHKDVFVFKWNKSLERIQASMMTQEKWETSGETTWRNGYKRVLIVEMPETETDPVIPGLYSSSSSNVYSETFKTFYKGSADFFLMDPPSPTELKMMYVTLRVFDSDNTPPHIDTMAKFNTLLNNIGPVPRYLFSKNHGAISKYLGERKSASEDPLANIQKEMRVSNIGKDVKYFMAPFIRRGVKVPLIEEYEIVAEQYLNSLSDEDRATELQFNNDIFEFRCLSEGCKLVLAEKVKTNRALTFLMEYGMPLELLEATIKYAGALDDTQGIGASVHKSARIENWCWYSDPGPVPLTKNHSLPADEIPRYQRCKSVKLFRGNQFMMKVWEMESGVLYLSTVHNFPAGNWLFVDHDKKLVYLHQATLMNMKSHAFRTAAIDKLMRNLHMFDEKGQVYKLMIIGVNDQSLETPTGMLFIYESENNDTKMTNSNETDTKKIKQTMKKGLKEWQERLEHKQNFPVWENANRVETCLARVKVFSLPNVELPDEP